MNRKVGCFEKCYPFQKRFSRPTEKVQLQKTNSSDSYVLSIIRILRVTQFIMILLVFALTIYMLAEQIFNPISEVFVIFILTLTTVYVFVTSLDIMTQFHGLPMHSNPMLLFSFLGIIFFTIAGNLLLAVYINNLETTWYIVMTFVLCFILALLYLFDVMSFLASNKSYPCILQTRTVCGREPETIFLQNEFCPTGERCKCNLAKSISSLQHVQYSNEVAEHACRKLTHGHRREYVDAQVSIPSLCAVDIAQMQTEPPSTSYCGVQTPKCESKEIPIQTITHCDTCHTPFNSTPVLPVAVPTTQPIYNSLPPSCGVCPGLIHLLQDKGQSCCNSCNCGSHHQTEQEFCEKTAQSIQTGNLVVGHDGATARLAGIPHSVTKVAMFSYIQRHKKTQTPTKNIISEEHVDIIDEYPKKESIMNEEPTTDKTETKEGYHKKPIIQSLTNKNKEMPEQAESDANTANASDIQDEYNGFSKSGTYRKNNKIRPIIRDSLYRN